MTHRALAMAFRVGKGYVVTLGTQVHFRAQNRATYKPLLNAPFQGPSTAVSAAELRSLHAAAAESATGSRP